MAIGYTKDKGDYYVITGNLLTDSVQAIIHQGFFGRKVDPRLRAINFHWNSDCNAGYYNLTITPEQIFFHSSHDNPNPNLLYWVISIDSTQYQQIRHGLLKAPPKGFQNQSKYYRVSSLDFFDASFKETVHIPDEWTRETEKTFEENCERQRRSQLAKYFKIINSYISDASKRIKMPDDSFQMMTPKYFGYSEEEVKDWMPVKFTMPVRVDSSGMKN